MLQTQVINDHSVDMVAMSTGHMGIIVNCNKKRGLLFYVNRKDTLLFYIYPCDRFSFY